MGEEDDRVTELQPGMRMMAEDLAKSGLGVGDLKVRPLGATERAATGSPNQVNGYVIPYFDINGGALPFYRVRLFNWEPKYRQIADTQNHIYFPPAFQSCLAKSDPMIRCIILTEGEKKAAAGCKAGFPTVAVGGVDSWRNRVLSLPKDTKLGASKNGVIARLGAGQEVFERTDTIATGFSELVYLCIKHKIPIVIAYDIDVTPKGHGQSSQVQAAAARLGYELRYRGMPMHLIRSIVLNPGAAYLDAKLGLDDYLNARTLGPAVLRERLKDVLASKNAFPRHPNPAEFVNKRLARGKLTRSDLQTLSTSVLCDLDSRGSRYFSPDDARLYYFDEEGHTLLPVSFKQDPEFAKSPFGVHLFRNYSINMGDMRLMQQLSAQFSAEAPLREVKPERVLAVRDNRLYYDLGEGRQVRADARGVTFLNNGADECLFASGMVQPLDEALVKRWVVEFEKAKTPDARWYEVLRQARIAPSVDDSQRRLLSLLYMISPWFYRWQNTQLPIEMMIGEAGSGKSSLYTLRMSIITGTPKLRNAPKDLKDWVASVANAGGLHVIDNVHMTDSRLRQELSDELCRVVTSDIPEIEARKLYSDNDQVVVPVQTVFALTAIKQPFTNVDIIQRSVITELFKGQNSVEYEENWAKHQLEKWGGREAWVAHQLDFQRRLFMNIEKSWQRGYRAKYRLINVEQLLILAAQTLGWDHEWIAPFMSQKGNDAAVDADWALRGLKEFAGGWLASQGATVKRFTARTIAEWAACDEEYEQCYNLTNSRALGQYLKSHANSVASATGIMESGSVSNATAYIVKVPD